MKRRNNPSHTPQPSGSDSVFEPFVPRQEQASSTIHFLARHGLLPKYVFEELRIHLIVSNRQHSGGNSKSAKDNWPLTRKAETPCPSLL